MNARKFPIIWMMGFAIALLLAGAGLAWAADAAPAPWDWKTPLAAVVNTAGVLLAVQAIRRFVPMLKERAEWLLPILAGALGPGIAGLQNALSAWLGVGIDLSPIAAIVTGGTAVAVHQVYKQATKKPQAAQTASPPIGQKRR